jgi:hypothetical protein
VQPRAGHAADDDKPQTSLVSFGADDGGGMSDAARAEQRRLDIERLEQLVNSLIMKFSTPSHLAAYAALPLPNAAPAVDVLALTTAKKCTLLDTLQTNATYLNKFYNDQANREFVPLHPLIRRVFSIWGSSAGVSTCVCVLLLTGARS